MPAYLGTLGRLVPIRCTAQPVKTTDRHTFETTLEGKVKAQRMAAARRSWAVSVGPATADQIASLWAFADGEWGRGPFVWVTPEAQMTNLLTPEVASCGPSAAFASTSVVSGPMILDDRMQAGRSMMPLVPSDRTYIGAGQTPVLPGIPVTGSVWAIGDGATVAVHWYSAAGTAVGAVGSSISGGAGSATRLHVTGVPPANATSCILSITRAVQWARPAVTWTPGVVPYGPGSGCNKAVMDGLERDPLLITDAHYRASASFTITEVG